MGTLPVYLWETHFHLMDNRIKVKVKSFWGELGSAGTCSTWRADSSSELCVLCLSGELVSALACHPEYKLLSVCTIPQMPTSSIAFSTFSWPALLKHLRQMLISNSKMEVGKVNWLRIFFSTSVPVNSCFISLIIKKDH